MGHPHSVDKASTRMKKKQPKSFNIGKMQMGAVQGKTFHLHRKFTRARHMWLLLRPDWRLLASHMYTDWPGIHSYEAINDRLFVHPGRNDNIQDTPSKARWNSPAHLRWVSQQQYMLQFVDAQVPPVCITMQKTLANITPISGMRKLRLQHTPGLQVDEKDGKRKKESIS